MGTTITNNLLSFLKVFSACFPHSPSEDQLNTIHRLVEFTFDSNPKKLFILNGYAGTGKTSLIGAYIKALDEFNLKNSLLAPTGRAAKVLSSKAGKQVLTIHKKIYYKKMQPGGKIILTLTPNLHRSTIFIIDESSMIGDDIIATENQFSNRSLLDDIITYVYSGNNCSLFLIGDTGQLPPIGSDISPALNSELLKFHYPYLSISQTKLKMILRQTLHSGILLNATHIRTFDKLNTHAPLKISEFNDIKRVNGSELLDSLEENYAKYGIDNVIMISKSNKRVNLYNQNIRSRILYIEDELVTNERLMVVRNNYFWLPETSKAGFIANGETIQVNRIIKYETRYNHRFARAEVKLIDYSEEGEIEVLLLIDTLNLESPSLQREAMKNFFFAVEEDYLDEKNKQKRYEMIVKNEYFNALQIKYAYAITCHKAQGGEWPIVYIDHDFLVPEMLDVSFYKWLYTAFTRSKEKIYLVNFDPKFFSEESEN